MDSLYVDCVENVLVRHENENPFIPDHAVKSTTFYVVSTLATSQNTSQNVCV